MRFGAYREVGEVYKLDGSESLGIKLTTDSRFVAPNFCPLDFFHKIGLYY